MIVNRTNSGRNLILQKANQPVHAQTYNPTVSWRLQIDPQESLLHILREAV